MDTVPSINDIEKLCTKISRLTFINQDKLQTCSYCQKQIKIPNIVENRETLDGLVSCDDHVLFCKYAMYLYQLKYNRASVHIYNSKKKETLPVEVSFYRESKQKIQNGCIGYPTELIYDSERDLLQIECYWTDLNKKTYKKLVPFENIFKYTDNKIDFCLEFEGLPQDSSSKIWRTRWNKVSFKKESE